MSDFFIRESGFAVPRTPENYSVKLNERIAELEFAAEDREGWIALGSVGDNFEFSRGFVTSITRLARLTYLKNPLVSRGVKVKADYVFGRQLSINARDETVDDIIQAFLDDPHNQTELTSQAARIQKEIELQTDGNIFFVLIPNLRTGSIRVRSLDVDEITDIICDPNDRKAAWYYKREFNEQIFNYDRGEYENKRRVLYYRDWRNTPNPIRQTINGNEVVERQFIYHVKVGGFSNWKFGVSELYAAIDWTKAYKTFLENWSTIVAAYARFAFKITTTGGKAGVQAATKRLTTTAGSSSGETNPAPTTASTFVSQEGTSIDPIRTAGATTSAEDGRRLLLMVCAAFGLPETFFGDVSVGTLATAKSLDRPTELMISNRQMLWADIWHDILEFILYNAVSAVDGPLRAFGEVTQNEYNEDVVTFDDTIDTHIDIDFPSVVEHDTTAMVDAIDKGAKYIGDPRLLARMVLVALGENDIDEILAKLYDEDGNPINPAQPITPAATNPLGGQTDPNTLDPNASPDDRLAIAASELRQSIELLRESLYPITGGNAITLPYDPKKPMTIDMQSYMRD